MTSLEKEQFALHLTKMREDVELMVFIADLDKEMSKKKRDYLVKMRTRVNMEVARVAAKHGVSLS